ncbi:DUF4123 domain-containing protein [Halopseudomonas sp.]|jgi:hypothetical protein|uniref:DUF4123 domain-containing protein n=1 Tax=Halopseudomonas sp. TaxID=2901191 RepID=UPI0039E630A1
MINQYLLLDGVQYEQALIRLYARDDDLEIEPLYAGTPWQEVADLGPVLVKPGPHSELLKELTREPEWHVSTSLLSSPAPLVDVATHLRQLNKVTDAVGNPSLLRYADPLVAWFWLNSYGAASLRRILGPVTEWRLAEPHQSWLPEQDHQWHAFISTEATDGKAVSVLGQAQMSGLKKAYSWQLKERLYTWLKQHQPADLAQIAAEELNTWFEEHLSGAEACGLISERSIAIWCALSLRHGSDFSAAHDGAYQQWNAHQSQPLYTADQRLQQYYQESV